MLELQLEPPGRLYNQRRLSGAELGAKSDLKALGRICFSDEVDDVTPALTLVSIPAFFFPLLLFCSFHGSDWSLGSRTANKE